MTAPLKRPVTEGDLIEHAEWAKNLCLSAGAMPETAFAVGAAWARGMRELMPQPEDGGSSPWGLWQDTGGEG